MDIIKPIRTIKNSSEAVIKEKGSVFHGFAFPAASEEEIQKLLSALRKKYFDATHHCYAFRLRDGKFKYSDDGEPSGTAGVRILNAIDHFEVTDILCVVVRWFGGTKLGVGPLGKAYFSSGEAAVGKAEILEKLPFFVYNIEVPYEHTSSLYHIFEKYGVKIRDKNYDDIPKFECFLPANDEEKILTEIKNSTNNRVIVLKQPELLYL